MMDFNHIILLHGKYPFTSVSLVLRKKKIKEPAGLIFHGFDSSKIFLTDGTTNYKNWIEEKTVFINPFSSLPKGVSRFFQNHSEFFELHFKINEEDDTVFHSDYFWLSNGNRNFNIQLEINSFSSDVENKIELRIHRYATLNAVVVDCCSDKIIEINNLNLINVDMSVEVNEDYCYAILCKKISGDFKLSTVKVKSCLTKNLTSDSNQKNNQELLMQA